MPERLPAPWGCELWRVSLLEMPSAADQALLSDDDLRRAAALRFANDRRRHLAAHVALRRQLGDFVGLPGAALRLQSGPHGKPRLIGSPSCAFNLSHSGDRAVIAIAPSGRIGVDIELPRGMPDAQALALRYFSSAEIAELEALPPAQTGTAFLRCWTRKEACLKAVGTGFSLLPKTFTAGTTPEQRGTVLTIDGAPVPVQVQSLDTADGMLLALARVVS